MLKIVSPQLSTGQEATNFDKISYLLDRGQMKLLRESDHLGLTLICQRQLLYESCLTSVRRTRSIGLLPSQAG